MICVLQIDSPDRGLLDRLLDEGRLPHLAGLAARGRTLELDGPQRQFPASAYGCLYRGVETGDHGLFYPFQWSARDGRVRLAEALPAPPPIWERLAAAGRTSLVIDPYESSPPRRFAGVLVSGWGIGERVVLRRWSRPEDAGRGLHRSQGPAPDVTETFGPHGAAELMQLREAALGAGDRTAEAAVGLLRERPFDLVWLTFAAPHIAGHRLWRPPADALADLRPQARGMLRSAPEEILVRTDAAVGKVLAALPEDADVIACSALGMAEDTSRADLLPGMLGAVLRGPGAGPPAERHEGGLVWSVRDRVGAGVRRRVAATLPDAAALALTARMELAGTNWSTTRAFAHPADNQGYVRLNLRGRERNGIVEPGSAPELMAEIAEGLATFRDPDGEPAVAEVEVRADSYEGRFAERLPDLVVHWRRTASPAVVVSDSFGEVSRGGYGTGRTGNHTDGDGWAMVAPGRGGHAELRRPARLTDVAATVAALSGVRTAGLAGEPLLTG